MKCIKCLTDLIADNYIETDWGCRLVYCCKNCNKVMVKNVYTEPKSEKMKITANTL